MMRTRTRLTRRLAGDGLTRQSAQDIASLGTWHAWPTSTAPVTLSVGLRSVVIWDSTGSSGAINLGNLTRQAS